MIKWIIALLIILSFINITTADAQAQSEYSSEAASNASTTINVADNATSETNAPETVGIDSTAFPKLKVSIFIDKFCALDGSFAKEDFHVQENGTDVTVDNFYFTGNASGQKLDLAVVFDDTDSMDDQIRALQLKVKDLTEKIKSSRLDARYCLVTFKGDATTRTRWTDDADSFKRGVSLLYASGGNNNLPEYPLGGIEKALSFGFRQDAQKVIIVVTDEPSHQEGDGTSDLNYSMEDVNDDLLSSGVMLIAVSPDFRDPDVDPNVPQEDLEKYADMRELADEAGGLWIDINSDDFSTILERFRGLLTGTYVLEYTSPDQTPSEVRNVTVSVDVPECVVATASNFYITPGSKAAPAESNNPPVINNLTSDKRSPQEVGALITWAANATDPDGDEVLYRFFLNGEPATNWTKEGTWSWTTSEVDLGSDVIEVHVRDGKHSGQNEADDLRAVSFNITRPEPSIEARGGWNKSFGGSGEDRGYSIQQTGDGGYIITGYTSSYGAGGIDLWLIKTDSNGSLVWNRTFGGSGKDRGEGVQQTKDGGYIIAGHTNSYGAGGRDIWMIKTDSNGSIMWDSIFGGHDEDWGYSIQETSDGGYIIAGDTYSFGAGGRDVWLVKTDSEGGLAWDRTFGGPDYDGGISAEQTSDGGYIIAGRTNRTNSSGTGDDIWLIKTDSNGSLVWDKIFGGPGLDWGYSVQQTDDGGYIITGDTESFGRGGKDAWLIKTDSNGSLVWDRTFGGPSWDWGVSVMQTGDGGYILAGSTYSYGEGSVDLLLIKTDSDGNTLWNRTLGGPDEDWGCSVQQTSDGGYIVTGSTRSYGAEDLDVWLIKTDSNGNVSR